MDPTQPFILQFFVYDHLPAGLQPIAAPFASLADWVVRTLPINPEREVVLRKLLEAKDAAVRTCIARGSELDEG